MNRRVAPLAQRESAICGWTRDPKKSHGLLRQAQRVRFAFIAAEKARYPHSLSLSLSRRHSAAAITHGCAAGRPPRARQDVQLLRPAAPRACVYRRCYGGSRLHRALRDEGVRVSPKRVRPFDALKPASSPGPPPFPPDHRQHPCLARGHESFRASIRRRPRPIASGPPTSPRCARRPGGVTSPSSLNLGSRRDRRLGDPRLSRGGAGARALHVALGTRPQPPLHHSDRGSPVRESCRIARSSLSAVSLSV